MLSLSCLKVFLTFGGRVGGAISHFFTLAWRDARKLFLVACASDYKGTLPFRGEKLLEA